MQEQCSSFALRQYWQMWFNHYRPQRSWAKVISLHACVCPRGVWNFRRGCLKFWGVLKFLRGGSSKFFFHFFFNFFPPPKKSFWDAHTHPPPETVNARPVYILLECILVYKFNYMPKMGKWITKNTVEIWEKLSKKNKKKIEMSSFNYDLKINYKYQNISMRKCFINVPAITKCCLNSESKESVILQSVETKHWRVVFGRNRNHPDLISWNLFNYLFKWTLWKPTYA